MGALRERHGGDPGTLIIEELGLGRGDRRVDVAVVNGVLHGFEIKSEADALDRLPGQAEAYSAALDRATLVAAERHLDAGAGIVPSWWGIVVALPDGDRVRLEQVREEGPNPGQLSAALTQLLWRDELLALLAAGGDGGGAAKLRRRELEALATALPPGELAPVVRAALKARTGWRGAPRPS